MTARRMTVSPNSAASDGTWQHGRVPPLFCKMSTLSAGQIRHRDNLVTSLLSLVTIFIRTANSAMVTGQ